MTKVFLKFRDRATPAARSRVSRLLRRAGALRVRRLFPRTTDPKLKGHYVAEFPGTAEARRAVRELETHPDVVSRGTGPRRWLLSGQPVP